MHTENLPRVGVIRFGKRIVIPRAEVERLLGASSLAPKWRDHSTFSVEEFAQIAGLSRTAAYAAVKPTPAENAA